MSQVLKINKGPDEKKKYNVIVNSNSIFEFGASPGGWSQIILEINPNVKITAIDLILLKLLSSF